MNLNKCSRDEVFASMETLKLKGMMEAYDEIIADGIKRQSTIPWVLHKLLESEIQARKLRTIQNRMYEA